MRVLLIAGSAVVGLAAGQLPQKDRMSAGYNAGYAVGYKAACSKEVVVIEGEWSNSSYSQGFAGGVADGTLACSAEQ